MGKTRPRLAFSLTVFLLSLAGIPPLAGFVGKILVFQAALQAGYLSLAVIAILTSVVAAYYYVRVVATMYFRDAETTGIGTQSRFTGIAIAAAAVFTVLLGLVPGWWYGVLTAGQHLLASR